MATDRRQDRGTDGRTEGRWGRTTLAGKGRREGAKSAPREGDEGEGRKGGREGGSQVKTRVPE